MIIIQSIERIAIELSQIIQSILDDVTQAVAE